MSDSDDDHRKKDNDADVPPYRIRHNDMNLKLVKEIVRRIFKIFYVQRTGEFVQEVLAGEGRVR
jgi:hypothetical protein